MQAMVGRTKFGDVKYVSDAARRDAAWRAPALRTISERQNYGGDIAREDALRIDYQN
jgi:hypothetical protein